nr:MAG: ORF1 [Torque teno midi virus]
MPFWWKRRRRPWFGRWFRRTKRRKFNRKRRRFPKRRKHRRTYRRRRRKYKVRRKRKTLTVKQWQPDSINNCHIKGLGVAVLGAEGKQFQCYTNVKTKSTPAKVPMGGGFGVEKYTLYYLYEEHTFHNNVWSKTNIYKDLCRYLWCKLRFYRHTNVDFIASYQRQPPFDITKYTYPSCHPQQLLQDRHKKIILSTRTKPNGKLTKKMFIKPPKQMISKWFFSRDFCTATLFLLKATACSFTYSYLGETAVNNEVSIFYINNKFYQNANWGAQSSTAYIPYTGAPHLLKAEYIDGTIKDNIKVGQTFTASISYTEGWFQKALLKAVKLINKETGTPTATTPTNVARYNPDLDDGKGNQIYLTSTLTTTYTPPTSDKSILLEDLPLWLGLYGFVTYCNTIKKDKTFADSHCVIVRSPAILPYSQIGAGNYYLLIDEDFINGKASYDQYITTTMKSKWFPTINNQMKTINAIIESGPFIQKLNQNRESSWELKYMYNFFFKWGGSATPEQDIANPKSQAVYDVPDKFSATIQIQNPLKQKPETFFQPWDYRRGILTSTAIKRVSENLSIDTDFQSDADSLPPKKKRRGAQLTNPQEETQKIQKCLQELCKENIYQETPEDQQLQQYIQYQQEQQQLLKYNLLRIIADMKEQQNLLQLQTGFQP